LDPYACYYGLIWSEWNKWVEYGYSTWITTFKVRVGASYDYICERWRQQFDIHYAPSLIINLWGFSKFMKVVVLGMWCLKHVSATNGNKVFKGLVQVNVKDVHVALQKMITLWIKKSEKGRQEWEKACIQCGMPPRKLKTVIKTKFASKVIMFEKTLEFKKTIITCYGRQNTITLQQRIPKAQVWAIVKVVTSCLNPMVMACVRINPLVTSYYLTL